jgi:hypothetical protein
MQGTGYVRFSRLSLEGGESPFLPSKRQKQMCSQAGNWLIGIGAVAVVLGLVALPAALGQHTDTSLLGLGACGVSLGSMIAAAGVFLKARVLDPKSPVGTVAADPRNSARRVRGGCDICHGDQPVIHCTVHQVHLCSDCLTQHYTPRSCTYVPSTRRTGKNAKGAAKAHGA